MKHMHYTEVEEEIPAEDGVKDTTIRWLIANKDGAENFAMRIFTLQPGGHTPLHAHDWEHEVFIVEGEGKIMSVEGEKSFKPGDFAFVPAGETHQFKNTGDTAARILCLVPCKLPEK